MRTTNILAIIALGGAAIAVPAAAQGKPDEARPQVLTQLYDCGRIVDAAQRLACFDARVAELRSAEEARTIAFADRSKLKDKRRGLFGLSLADLNPFNDRDSEAEEIKQIDSTIGSAGQAGYKWTFTLADGARWVQIDSRTVVRHPVPGMKVTIKKGVIGNYAASFDGQPAIKVRRVN